MQDSARRVMDPRTERFKLMHHIFNSPTLAAITPEAVISGAIAPDAALPALRVGNHDSSPKDQL